MNNEINIILAMIAGSGVFVAKIQEEKRRFGLDSLKKAISGQSYTILAKCVKGMSDEEIYFIWHGKSKEEKETRLNHIKNFPNYYMQHMKEFNSFENAARLISLGYLPEDLAKKLIEEGINIEWR